jgi:hypothetical protein
VPSPYRSIVQATVSSPLAPRVAHAGTCVHHIMSRVTRTEYVTTQVTSEVEMILAMRMAGTFVYAPATLARFTMPFDSFRKLKPLPLQPFVLLFDMTRAEACKLPAFFRIGAEFVPTSTHGNFPQPLAT